MCVHDFTVEILYNPKTLLPATTFLLKRIKLANILQSVTEYPDHHIGSLGFPH
jgi:hypothetical protein